MSYIVTRGASNEKFFYAITNQQGKEEIWSCTLPQCVNQKTEVTFPVEYGFMEMVPSLIQNEIFIVVRNTQRPLDRYLLSCSLNPSATDACSGPMSMYTVHTTGKAIRYVIGKVMDTGIIFNTEGFPGYSDFFFNINTKKTVPMPQGWSGYNALDTWAFTGNYIFTTRIGSQGGNRVKELIMFDTVSQGVTVLDNLLEDNHLLLIDIYQKVSQGGTNIFSVYRERSLSGPYFKKEVQKAPKKIYTNSLNYYAIKQLKNGKIIGLRIYGDLTVVSLDCTP